MFSSLRPQKWGLGASFDARLAVILLQIFMIFASLAEATVPNTQLTYPPRFHGESSKNAVNTVNLKLFARRPQLTYPPYLINVPHVPNKAVPERYLNNAPDP